MGWVWRNCVRWFFIVAVAAGGLLGARSPAALAAEAALVIKVRVVRCVTETERVFACSDEGLCCDFLQPEAASNIERIPQQDAHAPAFVVLETHQAATDGSSIWMRTLSRREDRAAVTSRL